MTGLFNDERRLFIANGFFVLDSWDFGGWLVGVIDLIILDPLLDVGDMIIRYRLFEVGDMIIRDRWFGVNVRDFGRRFFDMNRIFVDRTREVCVATFL